MKKIGLREQIFITVALSALIVVLCGVFLWKPQYDRISTAAKDQQTKQATLQQKEQELRELKAAKEEAPKVEEESLKLNKQMPEQVDTPSLVVEMEEIADNSNVKLLNMEFSEPKQAMSTKYTVIEFTGQVEGTYFNMADFLYQLALIPRQIKVRTISLESSEEGYPLLASEIGFSTYVYATDVTAGKATQSTTATQGASSSSDKTSSSSSSSGSESSSQQGESGTETQSNQNTTGGGS